MSNVKVKTWKDLEVWQLAHTLVIKIYEISKSFPSEERYRIVDQLCRAAVSVPTNIAEGQGRYTLKEYIRFLVISRGSVEEVKYLLLLSKDLNYIDHAIYNELSEEYTRVNMMLNKLISSLRSNIRKTSEPRNPSTESRTKNPETRI